VRIPSLYVNYKSVPRVACPGWTPDIGVARVPAEAPPVRARRSARVRSARATARACSRNQSIMPTTPRPRAARCIAACLGGIGLAAVFDALAYDNSHFIGGAPDLTVYRIARTRGAGSSSSSGRGATAAASDGGGGSGARHAGRACTRRWCRGACVRVASFGCRWTHGLGSQATEEFRDLVLPPPHCDFCGCDWVTQVCARGGGVPSVAVGVIRFARVRSWF
jgi:hypothetical protein